LLVRSSILHRGYLRAMNRLFAAVDARDIKRVLAIDGDQAEPRSPSSRTRSPTSPRRIVRGSV